MPSDDRLLLTFDGFNIVRRVHGAIPGDDTAAKAEGAVRSSIGTFKRLLKKHKPTHVAAAFDHGGETWRHRLYPQYHAGRKPMSEHLRDQLPNLFQQLEDLGITVLSVPDVEADDVIGTLVTKWWSAGKGAAIVSTTDKDLAQLMALSDLIRVYDQFKDAFVTEEDLLEKFCVKSALLGDCLSLMSDTVDGIPGVHKVGKKTAGKWLEQYGSLEGVLANADKLTGVVGQNLREGIELVHLSRKLVTLKTDVQLNITWNRLAYQQPAMAA